MKYTRLFCFLLMVCMLCTFALAGCEQRNNINPNSGSENSNSDTESTDIYQDADGNYVASTSGRRYDGKTVTFLTCNPNPEYESEILYNVYEGASFDKTYPDSLNYDLFLREDTVYEELGVDLEEIKVYDLGRKNSTFYRKVYLASMSGNEEFDIVVPCLYDGASLALADLLYNLREIEGLQIDAPWWNQEFNESMTYNDQLYFTIGDIGIVNKNTTSALYFNLDFWNANGLSENYGGTPYDLVRSGEWTIDVVLEITKTISNDNDENQKIDYKDTVGFGGQLDDMWSIFFASGEKIAQADADGLPHLTMYNERSSKLIEKMQELVQDEEHYLSANDYFGAENIDWPDKLIEMAFTSRRCMFYNASVGNIITVSAEMEDHFGIVPVPKADKEQESYYSLVNPWGSTCFAIPSSVPPARLEMIADVLNVMGAVSKNTVAVSYQNILDYMKTRDDDSKDMLNNYILPTRACDVGMVFAWGKLDILLQEMASEPIGTFASNYEEKVRVAKTELQTAIDFFKNKQDSSN